MKQLFKNIGSFFGKISSPLGKFLNREFKIKTYYFLFILWIPFKESSKTDPLLCSMTILFIILLGMEEKDKEELFSWAMPWSFLMPILVPVAIYFAVTKLSLL